MVKDAMARRFYRDDHGRLGRHLYDIVTLSNRGAHLKTNGLAPRVHLPTTLHWTPSIDS